MQKIERSAPFRGALSAASWPAHRQVAARPPSGSTADRAVRLLLPAVLAAAILFSAGAPAEAHPHVFITNAVTLAFSGEKLAAVRLQWAFDEVFSADVIGDFDANKDGRFDAAELPALQQGAFANLADYHHYLVYIWIDGKLVEPVEPRDFSARIDGEKLVYRFTVPLPAAVDPRVSPVKIDVYDEDYYIEVLLDEEHPAVLDGGTDTGCQPAIGEDESRPFYFNLVLPQQVTLRCPAS